MSTDPIRDDVQQWRRKLFSASEETPARDIVTTWALLDLIDEERTARGERVVNRDQFFSAVNSMTMRIESTDP